MPELPEVETYRRELERKLRNKKITSVTAAPDKIVFGLSSSARIKKAFLGRKIKNFGRKGKYLWMELDQNPWPVFHLGMTGSYLVTDKLPAKSKSIKLILELDDGSVFVFKDPRRFGRVFILHDALEKSPLSELGPDVFLAPPTKVYLRKAFEGRTAPVKALLLDQSLFAGIGNWMADEILFQSRIAPQRKAGTLSSAELGNLRKKIISVTKFSVEKGADSAKYPEHWLFHHRWGKRSGHVSSGESIRHSVVGGRSTAWVPELQKS